MQSTPGSLLPRGPSSISRSAAHAGQPAKNWPTAVGSKPPSFARLGGRPGQRRVQYGRLASIHLTPGSPKPAARRIVPPWSRRPRCRFRIDRRTKQIKGPQEDPRLGPPAANTTDLVVGRWLAVPPAAGGLAHRRAGSKRAFLSLDDATERLERFPLGSHRRGLTDFDTPTSPNCTGTRAPRPHGLAVLRRARSWQAVADGVAAARRVSLYAGYDARSGGRALRRRSKRRFEASAGAHRSG